MGYVRNILARSIGDLIEEHCIHARSHSLSTFVRDRSAVICERISHIYEYCKIELFRAVLERMNHSDDVTI